MLTLPVVAPVLLTPSRFPLTVNVSNISPSFSNSSAMHRSRYNEKILSQQSGTNNSEHYNNNN